MFLHLHWYTNVEAIKLSYPLGGSTLCWTRGQSTRLPKWKVVFFLAFRTPKNCTYLHNQISPTDWNATHQYLNYLYLEYEWYNIIPELACFLVFFHKFVDFPFPSRWFLRFFYTQNLHGKLFGISPNRRGTRCAATQAAGHTPSTPKASPPKIMPSSKKNHWKNRGFPLIIHHPFWG